MKHSLLTGVAGIFTIFSSSIVRRQVLAPRSSRTLVLSIAWFCASSAFAVDRNFDVPMDRLRSWSENVVVEVKNATLEGHSGVHKIKSDCEMHFGATVDGYTADPPGWVFEPMNVCIEPFFGKKSHSDKDWVAFAKSLLKKKVTAYGVPRIWPEHLIGGKPPSNPNHAMELHPLTKLVVGQKKYDFSKFIYAPEGFEGGLSRATALKLLDDLEVSVTASGNEVNIEFDAGRIGNFTVLDLQIDKNEIKPALTGGHRFKAKVYAEKNKLIPVTVVTVAGSEIDQQMAQLGSQKQSLFRLPALVLFSLDPVALYEASKQSSGNKIQVKDPVQLILYGKEED